MKIHLYKVADFYQMGTDEYSILNTTKVMTEQDLRNEFFWALHNHIFPLELLTDYQKDPDYSNDNWEQPQKLKIGTIIDMFNDIVNYGGEHKYLILETDIEL